MVHSYSRVYSRLEIEEAVNFARKSEFPGPDDLFEGMWANPIPKP